MHRFQNQTCRALLAADTESTSPELNSPASSVSTRASEPSSNASSITSSVEGHVHLELKLLGPFEARLRGVPFRSYRTQRVKTLLAFLAYHLNTPQERGTLMELLWPQQSTTEDMRQTLSRLRKVLDMVDLSPLLQAGRQSLCLYAGQGLTTDLAHLRQHLQQWHMHCGHQPVEQHTMSGRPLCNACQHAIGHALNLYHGELLEDVQVDYSEELTRWLQHARESLRQELLQALHQLITHQLGISDSQSAELNLERLLELEPFDEQAVRLFLELQVRRGASLTARGFYDRWLRRLKQEVGTNPEPATRLLVSRLFQNEAEHPPIGEPHLRLATQPPLLANSPPPAREGLGSARLLANATRASPLHWTQNSTQNSTFIGTSSPFLRGPAQELLDHTLALLQLPDCRLLTLYDVRDTDAHPWLAVLLERLRASQRGQVLILEADPGRTPQRYLQQLESILPLGAASWNLPARTEPREQSLNTRAEVSELTTRAARREPTLLVQLDLEPEKLDVSPLLERLHTHQQLRVLSFATGPMRVQVEHRLPLKLSP
ncbi:MAG: BTAD domain-containing putative transcriptional regulator [Myxococcota bacterium]